jgi:type II secretory pathway component PulC
MSKIKTYILLVIVIAIWGTIIYKVVNGVTADQEIDLIETPPTPELRHTPKEQPKYSMQLQERDPFLDKPLLSTPAVKSPKTKTKQELVLPNIIYKGLIIRKDSSTGIYLIQVEGQQFLFDVGEEIDGITLKSGTAEHVILNYKGTSFKVIK